jgi:hypothetical protein
MKEKTAQTQNPTVQPANPAKTATTNAEVKTAKPTEPFMPQRTLLLIGILAFITVILLGLALYTGLPRVSKPAPQVKILQTILSVSKPIVSSAKSYTSDITLTTERKKVTVVDIELKYDPKILTNVDIKPGTFFQGPTILRKTIDKTNGKVGFVLGIGLGDSPVNGNGTVAVLSFTTLTKSGITTISFLKESGVTVSTVRPSILTNARGIQFPFGPTQTP